MAGTQARRDKAHLKLFKRLTDYEDGGRVRNLLIDNDGVWLRYTDNVLDRLDINREEAKHLDEKQWRRLVTNSTQSSRGEALA